MNDISQAVEANAVIEQPKREVLVVDSHIPMLDTAHFEHMGRVAKVIASSSLLPDHLRGDTDIQSTGNCFLIVNQAVRWNMDPFSLMAGSFVVHGNLGFEGKVIAAAINSDPNMSSRLTYEYSGDEGTDQRTIVVSGTLKGENKPRSVKGSVAEWKSSNDGWKTPSGMDRMLNYRGSREWARMHNSDRLLGVYSIDEIESMRADSAKDITWRSEEIKPELSPPPTEAAAPPPEAAAETAPDPVEEVETPEPVEEAPEEPAAEATTGTGTTTWQEMFEELSTKIIAFTDVGEMNKWLEIVGAKFDWVSEQDKKSGEELDGMVIDKMNLLKVDQ